jgi:hypothetical protein
MMSDKNNDPSEIEPVHWYGFRQLLNTAKRVAESDTFSRNVDRRMTVDYWTVETPSKSNKKEDNK